jgi:hypothetical protein
MPYTEREQGNDAREIRLFWPEPVRGEVRVTMRVDR